MSINPVRDPFGGQPHPAPPVAPRVPASRPSPSPPRDLRPPVFTGTAAMPTAHFPSWGGPGFVNSGGTKAPVIAIIVIVTFVWLMLVASILVPSFIAQREKQRAAAESPTEVVMDGHSSLPGDHARLMFDPLPNQHEWVRERSIDAPYDGSEWWVSCHCSDDYMLLKYYTYKPPLDNPGALNYAISEVQNQAANDAAEPLTFETVKFGPSEGQVFRYRDKQGRQVLRVWIFGPVHSYRFECNVASRDSDRYAQCEQALRSLRVDA